MPARPIHEIRQIIAQAKVDTAANPTLKERFVRNHIKELSSPPYELTLDDISAAYDDPLLNPPTAACPILCFAS